MSGGLARGALAGFEHAQHVLLAHDEEVLAVDLDALPGVLAENDLVADFELERAKRSILQQPAVAKRDDFALFGFSAAESGITMPEAVVRCCSIRLTITRS